MQDKTTEVFKNAPIPKAVLLNVIPSIVSMIMVLVYNLADTFFIGQTGNAYMVAAVSVATPIFLLFMAVGMLFGIGGTSLISRLLGEGKNERAKNVSAFCFLTGLGVGILGMIFIWVCIEPICKLIGTSPETIGYAKEYLNIVAIGVPFLVVSNSFSSIIRAEGKANRAMAGMVAGNLVNIVLDPIMILVFGWDVAGAAIATVLGNIVGALFYITYLISKKSILSIHWKDYMIRSNIAKGVLAIGIPASLNSILMSSSNIVINNLMNRYGDMAVAGLGVAMKVNMIVIMVLIGLGTGVQPLLGYNFGAKNKERFLGVLKFSLILAFGLSLLMTVICYLGARPMVNAFLSDADALDYGMKFARIYIFSGPIMGILFVLINTLQGMGAAVPSLILSISRQGIIYIPVLFLLYIVFDNARMLAMAQPITDYLAVTLAAILFIHTYRIRFGRREESIVINKE
ncbi:MAG: MATE family efflux transporter [Lachnospiraceae bacterium]